MKFTPLKLLELLNIIELNHIVFIAQVIGVDSLSNDDINLLDKYGIDIQKIRSEYPELTQHYHWGRLTQLIKDKAKGVTYNDFKEYLKRGQYIPLNDSEKYTLKYLENKSYGYIKGLGDKVKQTVSGLITEEDLKSRYLYEKLIKDKVIQAVKQRESAQFIVSEIGNTNGDWERNLGRIAETELNDAMQWGRLEQIKRENPGKDPNVYKEVYPGACRYCIKLYLKGGIGSEPIIFKMSGLIANGTNINRKAADWKAVVGSTHPFCRCHLQELPNGWIWSEDKKMFVVSEVEDKYKAKGTIKVKIGDKVIEV